MNFLIDAQLPPALAHLITSLGHRATHVKEARLHLAEDAAIWSFAVTEGHVIVTKDEDFTNRTGSGMSNCLIEDRQALSWTAVGRESLLNRA